jgi:hypothetical protein
MHRGILAAVFFCISAFLYSTHYIVAAMTYNIKLPFEDFFKQHYQQVGGMLSTFSLLSLIAGIIYLILWEIKTKKRGK